MTTETFQDLSLTIPSHETLMALRNQPVSASSSAVSEGWVSWFWSFFSGLFYGPNITLEDCLAYFFSADELKGDNMYSCEKCKTNNRDVYKKQLLFDFVCRAAFSGNNLLVDIVDQKFNKLVNNSYQLV